RAFSRSNGSFRATTNHGRPSSACWRAQPRLSAMRGLSLKRSCCAVRRNTNYSRTRRTGTPTSSSSARGAFITAAGSRLGRLLRQSRRAPIVRWRSFGQADRPSFMATVETGLRLAKFALLVNALLAVGKIATGLLGNSYVLVADGIESTADIFSSLIVWGGLRVSVLPADENHPFGHGKAEPVAGIIVSMVLLAAALLIAVQSVREILTPHHLPAWYTLPVLVVVVLVKEMMFRAAFRTGRSLASTALKSDAWHHRSDALTSAAA